ncbi:hypothetical protein [Limibacterium fermenti]|uniref:hypothetical protein n=1 Tax=Limibacterium fermenti TaxID=3229863 RepID=UPI000E8A7231|nr:hypothetical protein [Porphyromonadaceae bacterium]HBX46450.1 hypothetical protein [Porphyromonadaceae bacterium]
MIRKGNIIQWFFLVLFTAYVGGISLFTHTHIINNTTYVHSHPYKKGEKTQHTHTPNQLFLLQSFYQTSLTTDIIPHINLADLSLPTIIPYIDGYEMGLVIEPIANLPARGPPARG